MRPLVHLGLALAVLVSAATAADAGGIRLTEILMTDNGDGDGYADTNETITLQLRVRNTTGVDLTGANALMTTQTPQRVCVTDPSIAVGDLDAGEERWLADAFEFHVAASADRTTLGLTELDVLEAYLRIVFDTDQGRCAAQPREIGMDLDLDVSGGSGATSYFESFEDGLGTFEIDNMDAGRDNLTDSDGYRCQYLDPDWINSNMYGAPGAATCYLGASASHGDVVYWRVDDATSPSGGRASTGTASLSFSEDLGAAGLHDALRRAESGRDGRSGPPAVADADGPVDQTPGELHRLHDPGRRRPRDLPRSRRRHGADRRRRRRSGRPVDQDPRVPQRLRHAEDRSLHRTSVATFPERPTPTATTPAT